MSAAPPHVRPATVDDAAAIARVHIASSEDSYAPLAKEWPAPDHAGRARFWAGALAQTDVARVDLVAEHDLEVVGFISGGPTRVDDVDAEVEIYVVHVLPVQRGRQIGGALWQEACARLRGRSLRSMIVQTLAELRCCSFYERRGGLAVRRATELFHGREATGLIYRWAAGTRSLSPEDS